MPYNESVTPTEPAESKRYVVDVQSVSTRTYHVIATSEEEARERFSDEGTVVHSETSSPAVLSVVEDVR